jgi:uncharacterized coiled-coil protein SlyX
MDKSYFQSNICQECGKKRNNIDFAIYEPKRTRIDTQFSQITNSLNSLSLENNNGLLKELVDKITNLEQKTGEISNLQNRITILEKTMYEQDYLINSLKDDVSSLKREISEFRNFMDI